MSSLKSTLLIFFSSGLVILFKMDLFSFSYGSFC